MPGTWKIKDKGPGAPCGEDGAPSGRCVASSLRPPVCCAGSPRLSAAVGISQLARATSSSRPPRSQCEHTLHPASPGSPGPRLQAYLGLVPSYPLAVMVRRPGLSMGGWGGEQVGQSPGAPTCHLCKQRLPGAPDGALKPSHVRASLPQPSRPPASHPESTAQWPRAVGTSPAGPGTLGRHYRLTRVRAHSASEATGETPAWRPTLASVNHSPASGLSPALN